MALSPLWKKAPLLLRRYPGLLLAVSGSCFLLTVALISYPVFISALGNRVLRDEIVKPYVSRYGAGLFYSSTNVGLNEPAPTNTQSLIQARELAFAREISRLPLFEEPLTTLSGPVVRVAPQGVSAAARSRPVRVFYRSHALDHVEVLSDTGQRGVWLADLTASGLGVGAGDRITITGDEGAQVTTTVGGTYSALYAEEPAPFWRPWRDDIYPDCPGPPGSTGCTPPPPFMLVGRAHFLQLAKALKEPRVTIGLDAPINSVAISMDEAESINAEYDRLASAMSTQGTPLFRLFECCDQRLKPSGLSTTDFTSAMPDVLTQVRNRVATIDVPIRLAAGAGAGVALTIVAICALYIANARRRELGLLFARGFSPLYVGAKASVECVGPACAGAAVGLFVSLWFAWAQGSTISHSTRAGVLVIAAGAALLSSTVIGLGIYAYFRLQELEARTSHRMLQMLPWEVPLLIFAGYCFFKIRTAGALVAEGPSGVKHPSVFLLAFPAFSLAGLALVFGRCSRFFVRQLRDHSRRFRPASFLMTHKIAGASGLALILFAATGLCVGVASNTRTLVTSITRTVDAKTLLFVGSDVAATVDSGDQLPESFPYPSTGVYRIAHAGRASTGQEVDLLAIDPNTFAQAAFWDRAFGADDLELILDELKNTSASASAPAIVAAGSQLEDEFSIEMASTVIPVTSVAHVEAFPGMLSERPLVVVGIERLAVLDEATASRILGSTQASSEIWVKGPIEKVTAALSQLEDRPYAVLTTARVSRLPSIDAVVDSFHMLNLLALVTATLVVGGTLMYVQARQRSALVAYIFSRRMGMTSRSHFRSLALELGYLLVLPFGLLAPAALILARVIAAEVDPLATIPPATIFTTPLVWLLGMGGVLVATTVLGAGLTHRALGRMNVAAAMRTSD